MTRDGPAALKSARRTDRDAATRGGRRAVERAQLVADRVGVQQRLRGVLARAVARVDERLFAGAGALLHGAGARVAQHRHVAEGLRKHAGAATEESCVIFLVFFGVCGAVLLFVELFVLFW